MDRNKYILLTIDVEDWFQVENFKPYIPFETWDQRELRVEKNVHKLLNLFDSSELMVPQSNRLRIQSGRHRSQFNVQNKDSNDPTTSNQPSPLNQQGNPGKTDRKPSGGPAYQLQASNIERPNLPTSRFQAIDHELSAVSHELKRNGLRTTDRRFAKNSLKATFFVLGWIAEKLPHLVREIHYRGHEVASHGYNHEMPNKISRGELQRDLADSKKRLEDITGNSVWGYRCPNFGINDTILKIIQDSGYRYDSSYNSFRLHGRYGRISLKGFEKKGIAHKLSENFYELPISNLPLFTLDALVHSCPAFLKRIRQFGQFHLPWGGGGYFRLLPFSVFHAGIKAILEQQGTYLFYAHPWEFDPDQPRAEKAAIGFKFRHYNNLGKSFSRLRDLITNFRSCNFMTCNAYLASVRG